MFSLQWVLVTIFIDTKEREREGVRVLCAYKHARTWVCVQCRC